MATKDTNRPPPAPRIRWEGNVGREPHAEWVENANDLIPRIHTVLVHVLPLVISSHLELADVEFMAEGTWNRTYTVRLRQRSPLSSSSPSSVPTRLVGRSTQDSIANLPSTPPSPYSSSSLTSSKPPSITPFSPQSSLEESPNTPASRCTHTPGRGTLPSYSPPRGLSVMAARDVTATELIMRVALPACPTKKTESEAATLQWVRQHTPIPVPRVYAYDSLGDHCRSESENESGPLGYEWMLMERMPGERYATVEETMSCEARVELAETLAEWVDSLVRVPFAQIGSLYRSSELSSQSFDTDHIYAPDVACQTTPPSPPAIMSDPFSAPPSSMPTNASCSLDSSTVKEASGDGGSDVALGPLMFQPFFGDWRLEYSFPRGPFATLHDFALACSAAYKFEISDPRQIQRAEMAQLEWLIDLDDLEGIVADTEAYYSARERREAQAQMDAESDAERLVRRDRMKERQDTLEMIRRRVLSEENNNRAGVSFEQSRLDFEELDAYRRSAAILDEIISALKPYYSAVTPSPTFLVHWDLSGDNVLVDREDGRPTALLDWEQVAALPLAVVSHYPRLLQAGMCEEVDDEMDDSVESRMRRAFDTRLKELVSPWLDGHGAGGDEYSERGKEEIGGEEGEEERGQTQTKEAGSSTEEPRQPASTNPVPDNDRGRKTASVIVAGTTLSIPPPPPSRRLLHALFSELRHSLHNEADLADLLQEFRDELEESGS